MAIEIETSTDSVEEVQEALGSGIVIEEAPGAEEGEEEKPDSEEEPVEGEPEEEGEPEGDKEEDDEDEDKDEKDEDDEKPAEKPKPVMVPKSRLNKERFRRKAAEERLAAYEAADEDEEKKPAPANKADEPQPGQTWSGVPRPKRSDFMVGVDPLDPEAVLTANDKYLDARDAWSEKEADAKAATKAEIAKRQEAQRAIVADFNERVTEFQDEEPDRWANVLASKVPITPFGQQFVYSSELGPHVLTYIVEHPKEAASLTRMRERDQAEALLAIEAKVAKKYGFTREEEEEVKPKIPKKPVVEKETPAALIPPKRLKPANAPGRTDREMAGPESNTGVDIVFSKELEHRDRVRKKV